MAEDVADHGAGLPDVLVAGLMSQSVVDLFQAVHVADHDGERFRLPFMDQRIQVVFLDHVGVLAAHAGHGIAFRHHFALFGAAVQIGVVRHHDDETEAEHDDSHDDGPHVAPLHLLQDADHEDLIRRVSAVLKEGIHFGDLAAEVGKHGLPHPDQGDGQDQCEKCDPDTDRAAESLPLVPLQDRAEEQEPEHAPYNEQEIGLGGERTYGDKIRSQEINTKGDHDSEAQTSGQKFCPVLHLPRHGGRTGGHKAVDQDRADGGDIHDPADGGTADEGDHTGDPGDQQDCLFRDTAVREHREISRKHTVLGKGIEETAESRDIADQARDDKGDQRQHEQQDTCASEIYICRIKSRQRLQSLQTVKRPDIFDPV